VGDGATTGAHHPPLPLESNIPGVFAVGDARSGSVKRVGGAIGEGAAVVAQLHSYLAATRLQQAMQSSTWICPFVGLLAAWCLRRAHILSVER
jgi:hypothetical protein